MGFRQFYVGRLPWRVLDLCGHVVFAVLLPGPFWVQFLPDLPVPILLIKSWRSDVLVPEDDPWLELYREWHTLWAPLVWYLLWLGLRVPVLWYVGLQWLVHVLWDKLTHREPEFQRSLWRFW